jgi:hypothetical protein
MELSKRLVLNRYFLDQLGFENFGDLKEKLRGTKEGFNSDSKSYFADVLIGVENLKIPVEDILKYDRAIKEYVDRLIRNRRDIITLKYFQYLVVLFTETFLDRYFNRRKQFLTDVNQFIDRLNEQLTSNEERFTHFNEEELKKLAYWMATGSGKTLIMHINYWQYLKYTTEKLDNIILVTPNEGLSLQHLKEMERSGIPCKLYGEATANLSLNQDEVLIIDIHKLTEEKKGAGIRVEVDYFEGKNLVFIDEGHKGQATEEKTWKNLREKIGKTGFIFEYSATFGQVIGPRDKDLLNEYSKAIVFDYSYKHFYADGYGKDFYVYNLSEKSFQEKFRDLILTGNLLSFYEQILLFEDNKDELMEYQIEKPLWAFIGSKVSGAGINSDVLKVVQFLKTVIENKKILKENIDKILDGSSGLTDPHGNDIFERRFEWLRKTGYKIDDIYEKLFNSRTGPLSLFELKAAEGEIALRMGEGEYFGVINIGDVSGFKKLLAENKIEVKPDNITSSLFERINESNSSVNILIGAKKFIDGWDSWRVCSMGLINMGKGEGPQIIQLFGRGVRLKGRNFTLKRSEEQRYHIKVLETLNIFGLNADYVNAFLETIRREEVEYEEIPLRIELLDEKKWRNLYILKTLEGFDFSKNYIRLRQDEDVLNQVKIDIRPKIELAHGLELGEATIAEKKITLEPKYLDLLDWDDIYLEILTYRTTQGYSNLAIPKDVLQDIIRHNGYSLYALPEQVMPQRFSELSKVEEIVLIILKGYIDRFYNRALRQEESKNLKLAYLDHSHENVSFGYYMLKIPKSEKTEIDEIKKLLQQSDKIYRADIKEIPTIHFDRHLYTPLVVYGKGKEFIWSSPPKLNEGETKFVEKLRDYVRVNYRVFLDTEIFALRNITPRGVKFFQTSGFYPDFIIWVKKGGMQTIAFVDPKGIRNSGNFNDEKIQLHKNIKEIEKRLGGSKVRLESFILSVSSFQDIKKTFDNGKRKKEEFDEHHVLFMEDENVIKKLLEKLS